MQNFKNFPGEHAPGPPRAVFSSICFKFSLPEKHTIIKDVTI